MSSRCWVFRNGGILQSFEGDHYWVSYYENRMAQKRLLMYTPVICRSAKFSAETYRVMAGGVIRVASASESYRLRFTQANGYRVTVSSVTYKVCLTRCSELFILSASLARGARLLVVHLTLGWRVLLASPALSSRLRDLGRIAPS
jgi:hypothetical protein